MHLEVQTLCWIVVLVCVHPADAGHGQFYGGSLSYILEDTVNGTKLVTVSLITGWVLGKGPCWTGCNKSDLGRSTLSTRPEALAVDSKYLGTYNADYILEGTSNTAVYPMSKLNPSPITERVIDISENAKYEQEIQTMSFIMPNDTESLDLNFEGASWRNLTLQGGVTLKWHFQTHISVLLRNDTNSSNHCPQTLARPFYRIKLDQISSIRIAAVDPDGDFIKCQPAEFIEGGDISIHKPPNVTIYENCTVFIGATIADGFRDDTWIGIAVSIRDYNTRPIIYGKEELFNSQFSLSTTTLQFVVQVLANLTTAEFVDPTLEGNHVFIMYADTTWRTEIYAMAPENTTIDSFTAFGVRQEDFKFSTLQDDPRRERVSHAIMSWQPSDGDVGRHIACVQTIDSTSVESAEQRCFVLHVQADTFNHTTNITPGKPYFVDIPSPDQFVNCKIKATCVIPLYVKCDLAVVDIHVIDSFIEEYHIGPIEAVQHKGETLYKADLFFQHSMQGQEKLCLKATDSSGTESETACITSEIEPPDPCVSSPCENSGVCQPNKTTGAYKCRCMEKYSGHNCDIKHDNCKPNPCGPNGFCVDKPTYLCFCKKGYTGTYCETDINDCKADSCSYHGSCIDIGYKSTKCECFSRYNGTTCDVDTCIGEDPTLLTCPAPNCHRNTCNMNGICSAGGVCTCSSGYTGTSCDTSVCDVSGSVTGVEILSPSIQDGSLLTCYVDGSNILPCHLRIYLATSSGSQPTITLDTSLASGVVSMTTAAPSNEFPGTTGIYSADLLVKGPIITTKNNFVCISVTSGVPTTTVCLELRLIPDPLKEPTSLQSNQINARIKFVEPSLKDHSRIICYVGQQCTVQLYTSFMTNKTCNAPTTPSTGTGVSSCGGTDIDNDEGLPYSCCEDVISSTTGVTVFPAHARGHSCLTEATVSFTDPGEKDICFQSGQIDYQQVCYTVGVYAANTDPCKNAQCQNGGHCFHDGHNDSRCVCPENYVGDHCEKGPCQPPDNICTNGAYCQTDNGHVTCICEAGYGEPDCSTVSASAQQAVGYATFTDTARPTEYTCVLHQICSLELIVSGMTGQTPVVTPGYISPSLGVDDISVTHRLTIQNSYLAAIHLKTSELGLQNVCLQTKDDKGINRDEICFVVHVISDVQSIYGFTDRPHFVDPSLLTNTEVICPAGKPCHVLYHVTTGVGNENECLDYHAKVTDDFLNYHIFTSCDNCVSGGGGHGQCTIDVSIANSAADIGHSRTFCVELGMKRSNVSGEERCFKVKVISQSTANVKVGCQALQCDNGGFCDGLLPREPVCYCPNGYSGSSCATAQVQATFSGSQSLISDFSIPSEVNCQVGKTCVIPFKALTKPGITSDVTLGYVDPQMIVDKPVVHTSTTIPTEHKGYVTITSKLEGAYTACLQATSLGKVEDEQCVKVTFIDDSSNSYAVDETKPYFLIPTMPADSSLICQVKTPCHLDMHFTNGDKFGAPGKCPNLADTSPSALQGLHVFDSVFHMSECTTDIVYVAPTANGEKTLCLKLSLPGKKGERRCYKIKVVPDITKEVVAPCKGTTCAHGGKCIGNPESSTTSGTCICSNGYHDSTCSSAHNTLTNLPGVDRINSLPTAPVHFSTDGAIPEVVKCTTGNPCCVHIPNNANSNQTPLLGSLGALTSVSNRSLTPNPGHHVFIQCVNGPSGSHMLCFQTSTNGTEQGVNIDEICVTVEISAPSASTPAKQQPHFTSGTRNGTIVVCKPSSTCHIPVVTAANTSTCSQVHECGDGIPGLHVFDTTLSPTGTDCFTDVAVNTGTAGSVELCISAGKGGEATHIVVKTENKQEFGPCQKKHCINGGKCETTSLLAADCVCTPGYTGTLCETDIDDCAQKPCQNNATCVDGANVFTCQCLPGFNGTHCEIDIDECLSRPCLNSGTCVDAINSYSCTCMPGFTDQTCNTNTDECQPAPCENNGTCKDGINGYTCACMDGFTGVNCHTNIDECAQNPCLNGGTCIDKTNGYSCTCPPGYTDQTCSTDINECTPSACYNNATCVDGINSYTCQCLSGYNGTRCKINIDECQPAPCENNGTCKDGINGYTCACVAGFTGVNCRTNIDECAQNPCLNGGACMDKTNGYSCTCPPGYTDQTCSTDINECTPSACYNNATCVDGINSYTCQCLSGYNGTRCEINIDECQPAPCENNGTCKDGINGYTCDCVAGFTYVNCHTNIDECQPASCENNGTCKDGINGYTCACVAGFTGVNCRTNIDDCAQDPCLNGGTCMDKTNGYSCTCPPGYTDQACSTNINECTPNACNNNATCVDGINSYTCQCLSGYNGTRCEITPSSSTGAPSSSTVAPRTTMPVSLLVSRTHTHVETQNELLPPAFIEFTIPEIIRCTVNKPCSIILPVDGKPGITPHVQHGHYDPGLTVKPVTVTSKRSFSCGNTPARCAYEALITVIPTEVKMFKYCVQTTDNHMVNADELCYKIQGIPDSQVTTISSFVYPPTLPDNSTMSCPTGQTCHYQIEVRKQAGNCDLHLVQSQLNSGAVNISEFENTQTYCKYDIAVTAPVNENGSKSFCFKANSGTVPTCLKVDMKNNSSGRQETCSSLHCDNGGFCDTTDGAPSRCLCKPGFEGKKCEVSDSCGIPTPDTVTCAPHQQCEYSFIVTGSKPTVVVDIGAEARKRTINNEHVVTVVFKTTTNATKVCINVLHGSCNDHKCVTVIYDPNVHTSATPGGFSSSHQQYTCETQSSCFVTTSTHLVNNHCPKILVHKDTTVANYHVFDPVQDGTECKATIAVTGSTTEGENQRICLRTDAGAQQCIGIQMKNNEVPCDKKVASDHARKMVETGYASCSCVFNGKKLNIIKKRPTTPPEKLYKAAGFGAGGMVGTIIIGVVIYAVVNKIKSSPDKKEKPTPSPRVKHKVHPQRRPNVAFLSYF